MKKITLLSAIMSLIIFAGCVATRFYKDGISELEQGNYYRALKHLEKAEAQNPGNVEISIALERARRSLADLWIDDAQQKFRDNDLISARDSVETAFLYYPGYPGIRVLIEDIENRITAQRYFEEGLRYDDEGLDALAKQFYQKALRYFPQHNAAEEKIVHLEANDRKEMVSDQITVSFDFYQMQIQDVFWALAEVVNLNVLIDETVQKDQLVDVKLKNVPVLQAMRDIASTYGLMLIKLESNTRILCADTPENRTRYSREDVKMFPMQYAEADRIRALLEPIANTAVVLADERTNSVVVRSRPDQMQLVSELINALDIRESEVVVEVEILEVTRSRMEDLGLDFGDSPFARAAIGGGVKPSGSGGSLSLAELSLISDRQIFITVPSLYLRLLKKDSLTRVLAQPRLRILNRTPARLHIGEQVPIRVTSSLFRNTSEELTSYQYRDVGIVMNMTPKILSASELALDLNLVVSSITHVGDDGQPTIGTREVETTLRLRHGEVEIIAGLIREDERKNSVRIPLVGDVPVLGRLFRSEGETTSQTDIVISLTPHILDRRLMVPSKNALWQGDPGDVYNRSLTKRTETDTPGRDATQTTLDNGSVKPEDVPGVIPEPVIDSEEASPEDMAEAIISVVPEQTLIGVGQSATVSIDISNGVNVASVPFYLNFDPTLLDIQDVREGMFMRSDGRPTAFMYSVDDIRGRIIIGLSRIGPGDGADGAGTLVEISVQGRQPGTSPLAFSNESVLNPASERLPAIFTDGNVVVTGE
jgi:general secretion pathway protein D